MAYVMYVILFLSENNDEIPDSKMCMTAIFSQKLEYPPETGKICRYGQNYYYIMIRWIKCA